MADDVLRSGRQLPPGTPLIARLWHRSTYEMSGCYQWRGSLDCYGYGRIFIRGRVATVHRVAYEFFVGSVPEGLELDHLCRNRACWNPAHLEPVTPVENTMRSPINVFAVNARKTHCKRGHELSGPNLRIERRSSRGDRVQRRCVACKREGDRIGDRRRRLEAKQQKQ